MIKIEWAVLSGEDKFLVGDTVKIHNYVTHDFGKKQLEGKIVEITENSITIDCSTQYKSNIVTLKTPFNEIWDSLERVNGTNRKADTT